MISWELAEIGGTHSLFVWPLSEVGRGEKGRTEVHKEH